MNGDEREFGELAGLAGKLRAADLSADSGVRSALRAALLARAEKRAARIPRLAWLLPAAAAAALIFIVQPRSARGPAAGGAAYALPDDGYGPSGRRGLGDYSAEDRF